MTRPPAPRPPAPRARADLGFAASLEDLDLTGLTGRLAPRPPPALVETAAAATGFVSREAKAPAEGATNSMAPRRRRTGRSQQFNLKARPETVAAFVAVADRMGWGLAETLERAVALLERDHGPGSGPEGG